MTKDPLHPTIRDELDRVLDRFWRNQISASEATDWLLSIIRAACYSSLENPQ